MPRQARNKGEFCVYHIIQRGNEKKSIFFSDQDRERFLDTLQKMKNKYNFAIYAYCLMDNHTHLLINDNGNDISQLIKSINISYVYYINRCYKRCGHLFQDRFRSEIVSDDRYLLQVSKYIHNNPVKAGLVKEPGQYRWSSYNIYMGKERDSGRLIEPGRILRIISNIPDKAVNGYKEYMGTEETDIGIMDIEEILNEGVINTGFISNTKEGSRWLEKAALERGCTVQDILDDKEIRNCEIKKLRKNSSLSLKYIGELFGGISESRVSRIITRD